MYSVGKRLRGKKTACSPRRKEKKNNGLISKILDWCRSFVFIPPFVGEQENSAKQHLTCK
jgi:hypothetical protein